MRITNKTKQQLKKTHRNKNNRGEKVSNEVKDVVGAGEEVLTLPMGTTWFISPPGLPEAEGGRGMSAAVLVATWSLNCPQLFLVSILTTLGLCAHNVYSSTCVKVETKIKAAIY